MRELAMVVAKLIDPAMLLVAFIVAGATFRTGKVSIFVTAVVVGIAGETLLTTIGYGRHWGQSLVPGIIAGAAQAALSYWVISKIRNRKGRAIQHPEEA